MRLGGIASLNLLQQLLSFHCGIDKQEHGRKAKYSQTKPLSFQNSQSWLLLHFQSMTSSRMEFIGSLSTYLQKERKMSLVGQRSALHNLVIFQVSSKSQVTLVAPCQRVDESQNSSEKRMKVKYQNHGEKKELAEFVPHTFVSLVHINIKTIMPVPYPAGSAAVALFFQTPGLHLTHTCSSFLLASLGQIPITWREKVEEAENMHRNRRESRWT